MVRATKETRLNATILGTEHFDIWDGMKSSLEWFLAG